jgi:hypothetical protein
MSVTLDGVWDWIFDLLTTLTQLTITLNYRIIANFDTLQLTSLFLACSVFTNNSF